MRSSSARASFTLLSAAAVALRSSGTSSSGTAIAPPAEHVVEQDQAALARALERLLEVDGVSGLVGIDEREVEHLAVGQRRQGLGGGADADFDAIGDAGVLEVARGDLGELLAELAAEQAPGGLEAAGDADRRVAGERADLERLAGADRARQERHERALVRRDLHPAMSPIAAVSAWTLRRTSSCRAPCSTM